jgi:hypothetical protein
MTQLPQSGRPSAQSPAPASSAFRGLRDRAGAVLLAAGIAVAGPAAPAAAQDAAPVGSLLADYDGLPVSHPGRVIIEGAVGNYALGLVDAGGDCPRYDGDRPATPARLFLAWLTAARAMTPEAAATTEWRASVAGWVPVHCGA